MRNKEHLASDQFKALKDGLLFGDEAMIALKHIGECDRCAEAFADRYTAQDLLELPADFKSAVLSAADRERKEIGKQRDVRNQRQKAEGRRELYRYSFRVSIAACITLVLLFSGSIRYGLNFSQSIRTGLPKGNVITENLKGFSDKLIDFEVIKYLKEE